MADVAGFFAVLMPVLGPFLAAWVLAGQTARRNVISMDLSLAGLAGALAGFIATAIPAIAFHLVSSYGLITDPLSAGGWFVIGACILAATWFGFIAGLAYVLLRLRRRRAAAAFLFTPLALYLLAAAVCAALPSLGATWARSLMNDAMFGTGLILPSLLVPLALWLLVPPQRGIGS